MGFSWMEKAFLASALFVGLTSGIQAQQGWNPEKPDTPIGDDSSLVEMVEPGDSMEEEGAGTVETKKKLDPNELLRDPPLNKGLNDFGDFVKDGLDEREKMREALEKAMPKKEMAEASDNPPKLATPSQSGTQIPQTSTEEDANSHFDGKYRLKPNMIYEANGASYETNGAGGIKSWSATLDGKATPSEYEYSYHRNLAGKNQEMGVFDDAGHLVAREQGGSGKSDNLVAMEKHVNRRDYRAFERENNQLLQEGYSVRLSGVNYMPDDAVRPQAIMVTRETLDENGNVVATDHFSWTNLNMEEYQDNDFGQNDIPNAMDETLQSAGLSREEIEAMEEEAFQDEKQKHESHKDAPTEAPTRSEDTSGESKEPPQNELDADEEWGPGREPAASSDDKIEEDIAQSDDSRESEIHSREKISDASTDAISQEQTDPLALDDPSLQTQEKEASTEVAQDPIMLDKPEERRLLVGETIDQKKLPGPEETTQSPVNLENTSGTEQGHALPLPSNDDGGEFSAKRNTEEMAKADDLSENKSEGNQEALWLRQEEPKKDNLQEETAKQALSPAEDVKDATQQDEEKERIAQEKTQDRGMEKKEAMQKEEPWLREGQEDETTNAEKGRGATPKAQEERGGQQNENMELQRQSTPPPANATEEPWKKAPQEKQDEEIHQEKAKPEQNEKSAEAMEEDRGGYTQ